MGWIFAAVMVVVVVVFFVIGTGRGGELAPQLEDRPAPDLPGTDELGPEDLKGVQFAVTTRGYSMAQVDALLDRVARRWQQDLDRGAPSDDLQPSLHIEPTGAGPDSRSGQGEEPETPSWQPSAETSVDAE